MVIRMRKMMFVAMAFAFAAPLSQAQLRIGVSPDYPPFEHVDRHSELAGFDVDVGNAICRQLNESCRWIRTDFTNLISGLNGREFDLVISSLSPSPERARQVAFTTTIYLDPKNGSPTAAAVRKSDTELLRRLNAAIRAVGESGTMAEAARAHSLPDSVVAYKAAAGGAVQASSATPAVRVATASVAISGQGGGASASAPAASNCPTNYLRPEPNGYSWFTPGAPPSPPEREWPMERIFSQITEDGRAVFHRDGTGSIAIDDAMERMGSFLRGRHWTKWSADEWGMVMDVMTMTYKPFGNDLRLRFEATRNAYNHNMAALQCYQAAAGNAQRGVGEMAGADAAAVQAARAAPAAGGSAQAEVERLASERAREADAMAQHAEQADAEASERDRKDPRWRFEYLPSHHRCLRIVDVRADGSVRGMYWYALQNVCDWPLKALWCEKNSDSCAQGRPSSAWTLAPHQKAEHLWERRKDGRTPEFHGFACAVEHHGRPTTFDFNKRRCRGWAAPL